VDDPCRHAGRERHDGQLDHDGETTAARLPAPALWARPQSTAAARLRPATRPAP
jgi:hypothetical protein